MPTALVTGSDQATTHTNHVFVTEDTQNRVSVAIGSPLMSSLQVPWWQGRKFLGENQDGAGLSLRPSKRYMNLMAVHQGTIVTPALA